jgi:hypothetical protein
MEVCMMDLIVEMHVGSHLYGTATARSDHDVKAVYLPVAADILLQRVRGSVIFGRTKALGEKNTPDDTDFEAFSLQRYLEHLAKGQAVALEMLFAPDSAMLREPAPLWRELQAGAPRLVSRCASGFVRYCRRQANGFGIKGVRVAAARQALEALCQAEASFGGAAALELAEPLFNPLLNPPHVQAVDMIAPGGRQIRHLEVCGKLMPFTGTIKSARVVMERLVSAYGERALQAARQEGVDWPALSHAVRVGREAVELFRTGRIPFPLPYAAELLAIKLGERRYEDVADEIERLLVEVEASAASSQLPEAPDIDFIERLVARAYRAKVEEMP